MLGARNNSGSRQRDEREEFWKSHEDWKNELLGRGSRKVENAVIDADVGFAFVDDRFLFVVRSFASGFYRKRNEYAADLFIIAQVGLYFHLRAVLDALVDDANLQKVIGIEINEVNVAIFADDLQLVRQRAVDVFRPQIIDCASLGLPVVKWTFDFSVLN